MSFPASNVIFPYNKSRQHQDMCAKLMDMNIEKNNYLDVLKASQHAEIQLHVIVANDIECHSEWLTGSKKGSYAVRH